METIWLISSVALWGMVLLLGLLLLGALRALGLLSWRVEQLEATTPSHRGRSGLKPGQQAPDFILPSSAGAEVALSDFTGRRVLLVFTQTGCGPCHQIVPELNRLDECDLQVLVVNNGEPDATRRWADDRRVRFPVLIQEHFQLSRRYEVFATPFAFLIDEGGVIRSTGIIAEPRHLRYVLSRARAIPGTHDADIEPSKRYGRVERAPARTDTDTRLEEKNHA
jgi:methylamine dehydrogenase accessory protein MauD